MLSRFSADPTDVVLGALLAAGISGADSREKARAFLGTPHAEVFGRVFHDLGSGNPASALCCLAYSHTVGYHAEDGFPLNRDRLARFFHLSQSGLKKAINEAVSSGFVQKQGTKLVWRTR